MGRALWLIVLALLPLLGACAPASPANVAWERAVTDRSPIIIAHRGTSGERPEHTLAAYQLAIDQGADFIEPDLVLTRDGVLVARHENEISGTTNVADHPEFANRRTTKTIDGEQMTGWFTEDFTLAELRTLRARERLPQLRPDNTAYDGQFLIPTFEEILELARDASARTGRTIGVYPETKHPSYFIQIGLPHEGPLLYLLDRFGHTTADAPIFIQSFEVRNLEALNRRTDVRLIQLIADSGGPADNAGLSYADMVTTDGLAQIARYADGIGPAKDMVITRTVLGALGESTGLVARAHAAGLEVHPWTFRRENYFLPLNLRNGVDPRGAGDLAAEIRAFVVEGVDGLFTDNPIEAAFVRRPGL
jgi:glycerophosphoryl diester phosphodiesterase